MRIEHVALWADDLELLMKFYVRYFGAVAGEKYVNPATGFSSYFLSFPDGPGRLEIMNKPSLVNHSQSNPAKGFCHLAIAVGSMKEVDLLTKELRSAGVAVISEPRMTGDGYYESVIADPEGNQIEITA